MIKINKKFIRIYLVFLSFIIFEARGSFAADTDNYNSIEKCIQIGLKNNTGLLKAKYDLKSANEAVKSYRALFEPAINLSGGRTDIDAVGYDIVKDGFSAGIKKQFYKTGGQLQLSSENEKTDTSSPLSSINPYYSSEVSLSYIQPLTENFFGKNIKTNMNQITIGKDISLMSFIYIKQQLVNTIKKAYAEYAYAHKNLRINKEKLDRAKKLFALNKQKFIDGLIEEVDLIATEAAVTINEAATMKAETAVEFSHDNLCYIVGVKPKDYNTEPSTKIYTVSINHTKAIAEDILKNALENRQDLKILKAQKQKIEMDYSINKNKKLPSVNLITRYGILAEGPDYNAT
jgi:outer membrane protein TolC